MTGGGSSEGSVLTAYANDERAVWKEFRRELVADGFTSSTIRRHKQVILAYVKELGSRGLLDEMDHNGSGERGSETGPAGQDTMEPQVEKRSPNEPASSLQDINFVEDNNPEERSTRIQLQRNPASDVKPIPSLKPGPISKDSTPHNSEQEPRAHTTTSPTTLAKLRAIELRLHTDFIPRCEAILHSPPADRNEWSTANPKQLAEEILQHVIFELDAIDPEGDAELRALRRDLVCQAQECLIEIDVISEPGTGAASEHESPHHFTGNIPEDDNNLQDESEPDIWPPGAGPYPGQQTVNGPLPRFRHDASGPWPEALSIFDDDKENEFEEGIEPGVSGKYAAWLAFAEGYIEESRLKA